MDSNSPRPSSSSLTRSRLNPFFTFLLNPSNIQKPPSTPFIIFFFIFVFVFVFNAHSASSFITDSEDELTSYKQHCHKLVPMSLLEPENEPLPDISHSLGLRSRYFYGGHQFFNATSQHAIQFPKLMVFIPTEVRKTVTNGVYQLRATLRLQYQRDVTITRKSQNRNLRQIVYRGPKVLSPISWDVFTLYGFWSESSGKLCMVESKSNIVRHFGEIYNVNIKFDYPKNSSIFGSLVSGIIETFSDKSSSDYFERIFVLGLYKRLDYKYTLLDKEVENDCSSSNEYGSPSRHMEGACSLFLRRPYMLELKYGSDCHGVNCNPLGKNVDYIPKNMYFLGTQCAEERTVQILLRFPNFTSHTYYGTTIPFQQDSMLIGEGLWNGKENRLCARACRILVSKDSEISASVSDCSIKLNLRFPETLSLKNRSNIVGQIWSERAVDESGYFGRIGFQSIWNVLTDLQRLKYVFTETNMSSCLVKKTNQNKGRRYPSAYSSDMRFYISVRNSGGQLARGFASPLFVGDKLYDNLLYSEVQVGQTQAVDKAKEIQPINISYKMSFTSQGDFKINGETALGKVQIAAEGVYDLNWGLLCMRGCRHVGSDGMSLINETLDCNIMVNVQFPPLNAKKGEFVKGTIESTRHDSDPFYFHPLEITSSSTAATIWRMDVETIMVLISNTLACIFLGLQLLYVKKHPTVLPLISTVMLVVLTLSHMIPLLLNFEALFIGNHSEKNMFLRSGDWLEMNEIIVRIVTMIAFLLQLLFLQMSWSARRIEENQQVLWISERKVLYVSLPLYVGGGLIAWYVHQLKISGRSTFRPFHLSRHKLPKGLPTFRHQSLWEALTSYAGLLRDGFLLPQILFNIFHNSEGKTLAFSFYLGTTAIRLLPHAYDLYRAQTSPWYLDLVFIYASQKWDLYSTAWDIIIILCGFLFSVLICLQQRFGGRFMLPRRFKESSVYQIVPVITNDDL